MQQCEKSLYYIFTNTNVLVVIYFIDYISLVFKLHYAKRG